MELGQYGAWVGHSLATPEDAAAIEKAGYGAIWLGGSPPATLPGVDELLDATSDLIVATGITNVWTADAAEVAQSFARVESKHPGRFLLGIGIGHPEATTVYRSPMQTMNDYLDVLDREGVPADRRIVAALGPRMLELARDRSWGSHPYLTAPQHTAYAREVLGPDAFLAPEHKVVLGRSPQDSLEVGRPAVVPYLRLRNYLSNLRRIGYTDADLANGGSDRLINALVLNGPLDSIAEGLSEHLSLGADHVTVQALPREGWCADLLQLAPALGLRPH